MPTRPAAPPVVARHSTARMAAPDMRPTPPTRPQRPAPPRRGARTLSKLAALGLGLALAVPLSAQDGEARPARPDQIAVRARRGNAVTQVHGVVTKNGLDDVVATVDGKEEKFGSEFVLSLAFGDVPNSYRDGVLFSERGDHASAAANFKLAAGDAESRAVVAAAARLRAAESLLAWGASDPTRFAEAAEQAERFLADHVDNREVPLAQMVRARALLLAGKPAEAAAAWREVHGKLEGDGAAKGYRRVECFRAGLLAARALLAAGDTLGARELFASLTGTLGPLVAGLEAGNEEHAQLAAVLDEAGLGEGFAELAAGNVPQALTFFQNQKGALTPESRASQRYGTLLGLGEALLASKRPREAQIALAEVSAMEPLDRDRVARALLGQIEAATALGEARERIVPLVDAIVERYGDTPSAPRARQLK
jgi:tetratricopeptide (TPR) repeat protein